jgi:hypothetical protein
LPVQSKRTHDVYDAEEMRLVEPHRHLVQVVTLKEYSVKKHKLKERELYLFNDLLLKAVSARARERERERERERGHSMYRTHANLTISERVMILFIENMHSSVRIKC